MCNAAKLEDLLTDDDLRTLAQQDHYRDRGELSPEHQRLLAMCLPELCGALLAQRFKAAAKADHRARNLKKSRNSVVAAC